jgi:L-lactate dehydrogenase complex protein LldF
MKRPILYRISGKAGRVAQKPLLRDGSIRPVPGPLSGWIDSRDLPPLAEKSFRELWKEGI